MTIKFQVFLLIIILAFLISIIRLLKKNALELRYSILWITTGIILLIIGLFPRTMEALSSMLGVYDVTNTLFTFALIFVLILLLFLTSVVSKQAVQIRKISQKYALLEREVEKNENTNC